MVLYATPKPLFVIQLLAALHIGKPIALLAHHESDQEKRLILSTNMTVDAQGELLEIQENKQIKHHPELALVLFTSGSTGQMKAVQLSLKNIIANCQAVINALEFSKVVDQLLFYLYRTLLACLGNYSPG